MIWEEVPNDQASTMSRTPIFGGWLVSRVDHVQTQVPENWGDGQMTFRIETGYEWRTAITFVPDPNWEWDLTTEYGPL